MYKFNKRVFRIFLIIAIPLSLFWCGIVINNLMIEKQYTVERIIGESLIYDSNTSFLIGTHMNEIYENLKVIRDSNEMSNFLNDETEYSKTEFVNLLLRIMSNKADFDQVKFIDIEGNEIVRVDNEEELIIYPSEKLKNIKSIDWFLESLELKFDEVMISSLVLNSENDKIEIPYKPVIRFTTPVINSKEELKGMLVVIYNAEYFMNMFSVHTESEESFDSNLYVLNGNGDYILHPEASKNFAFMFDDKKQITIQNENKDIWNIVNSSTYGSTESNNKLIIFYDVLESVKESNKKHTEKWLLVHEIDISQLFSFNTVLKSIFMSRNTIAVVVIFILAYIISRTYERLRRSDYQLEITRKISETTNDAVLITDADSKIIYVNQSYEKATGYSSSEVIGAKPGEFKSGKHDAEFYRKMWQEINTNGSWEGNLWDKKKDGLIYPKHLKILAIKDKTGMNVRNYIGVFSDLSEARKKAGFLEGLDYSEGELKLPNEEMMLELLNQNVYKQNFNFIILSIMIENYNQLRTTVKDSMFNTSDAFIRLISPKLGNNDFVAQTGKNLFTVIFDLQQITDSKESFVENIHKELTKVMIVNEQNLFFKIRIGVSYWTNDTEDLKKLLLNSIIALEWTTSHQESEIAFYSNDMIQKMNKENEIEGHLRKAVENNELFLVYQPQINIETNTIVGMEALLRWENKTLGFVPPVQFIPIAEKSRLIIEIGDWVITKVCEDIEYLNKNFIGLNETIRCAVNLSTIQMAESDFLEKLFNTIEKYDVENSQLEMEITESMLLSNEIKNIKNIEAIRNCGIKIAIDDFGTGYSSLSYLNSLPFDKIKVDRTFIKNYPDNDDGKLAAILVNMAKALETEVLMEGAETLGQVEYLKKLGCNYIQGYYYSKPLKLKDFIDFLKRNNKAYHENL